MLLDNSNYNYNYNFNADADADANTDGAVSSLYVDSDSNIQITTHN